MGITSALVLLAVIWWMTFLIVLPIRVQTQGDLGKVEPGTHAGAPQVHNLKTKALITTGVALVLWGIISSIILLEVFSLDDLSWFTFEKRITGGTDG